MELAMVRFDSLEVAVKIIVLMKKSLLAYVIKCYLLIEKVHHYLKDSSLQKRQVGKRECSGSVVECLTQDRGATGSSLTGVTALCP